MGLVRDGQERLRGTFAAMMDDDQRDGSKSKPGSVTSAIAGFFGLAWISQT